MTKQEEYPPLEVDAEWRTTCVCCPICRQVVCDGVAKGGLCEDECDCSNWSKGIEA